MRYNIITRSPSPVIAKSEATKQFKNMKLLIIGASGVLGSRLYNDTIKKKWSTMGTYCSHECEGLFYLDVRDKNSLEKVFNLFKPETVVMAGGITDVDMSELKPKLAKDVNIKGTQNLVKKIKEYGAKLVYTSTDYVFDGENGPYKESDETNPVNVYGKTKLEAEQIVESNLRDYLIIRTSQLYGVDYVGRNFIMKIINNIRRNKKIYAADDFYSTPTYSGFLSEIIMKLIEKGANGLYHGAGPEFLSRFEYVNKILDIFEVNKDLIEKIKLKDLKLAAKRPKKCGFKIDKIRKAIDIKPQACDYYLKLLKGELHDTGI